MLGRLAGTPPPPIPGALEDDPLTSPSFSMMADPATDSRSYGHARKASKATASTGNDSSGPLASNGGRHDSGSYPAADYTSPAYGYPAEAAPAPAAPAVPVEWYSSPPAEPAPAYGNPYSYPEASTAASLASPAADPGYGGYLADPLRVYSPPPYESPAATGHPDPYPALPALGVPCLPGQGRPQPTAPVAARRLSGAAQRPGTRAAGSASVPPMQAGAGYAHSYDGGYGGDPYAADGYGPYPPQG